MNPRQLPVMPAWYPGVAKTFLTRVLLVLGKHLDPRDYGVFVFGSVNSKPDAARYSTRGTSDIDTLVVISDAVDKQLRKLAWTLLNAVERASFANGNGTGLKGFLATILRSIERQTGMHENIFVCTERAVTGASFARIFRTNKILSRFLAPATIVTGSALSHVRFLHGNDRFTGLLDALRARAAARRALVPDLFKSLVMNLVLSLGGIVLLPLTPRATRYAIEATKWSLYASSFAITGSRPSKRQQATFFTSRGIDASFLASWLGLSTAYRPDPWFALRAPATVIAIHVQGLRLAPVRWQEKKK